MNNLPEGIYKAKITEHHLAYDARNESEYYFLKFKILSGPTTDDKTFEGFTIEHRAYFGDRVLFTDKSGRPKTSNDMTVEMLQACGWDGKEALDSITGLTKEVMISVVMKPGKDGKDYPRVKSIRREFKQAAVPKQRASELNARIKKILAESQAADAADQTVPF
jgi:hypothetical protein